jgi:hypothetical protein
VGNALFSAVNPACPNAPLKPSYFPMQKVKTCPDSSVYAGSSDLAFSWRLAGDLNSDGNFMLTSTEPTRMHRSVVSFIVIF